MSRYDDYLEKAKDMAEAVVNKAREMTEEGSKARDLTHNAREQASAIAFGAREKVNGLLQDARAVKEIRQGISELEALPEFEGSILYNMELETMIRDLNGLLLIINDNRLDDASVTEEIRKVMNKVQPDADQKAEESSQEGSAEKTATEKAKAATYSACERALEAFNVAAE